MSASEPIGVGDDRAGEVLRIVPRRDEGSDPVPDPNDSLAWLSHLVFDRRASLGRARPIGPDRRVRAEYLVHPSLDEPQLFIPSEPRVAATALGRFNDGMELRKRVTQLIAQPAFRFGIGQRLKTDRLWLTEPVAGARPLGSDNSDRDHQADLESLMCELAGLDEGRLAITIGPPRANRKPVAQLIGLDGTMHLVAKVGWNVPTGRLVANEAWWLRRAASKRGRRLVVPALVDHRPWRGSDLVIQDAVRPSRIPRGRPTGGVSTDLVLDIAALDPSGGGRWPWADVTRSIAARYRREGFADLAALTEAAGAKFGGRLVPVGAWHGDLSPWNLMTRGHLTTVIDWEFAAESVPVGWDLVNHHVQVGMELAGLEPIAAFERAIDRSVVQLIEFGVPTELTSAVAQTLLLELVARSRRLDPDGVSSMQPVALAALEFVSNRTELGS